jgi:actin-related protein 5
MSVCETFLGIIKRFFDRNVVTQFEHEETMLDYGFYHLGINSEDQKVNHPIVMSEAPANPISSRSSMNELLFENYQIPKVSYGIDGLFSLFQNESNFADTTAMIISFGFHSVHFIPIIKGKLDPDQMRRLNVGGFHLANFLHRGLQIKIFCSCQ